MLKPYTDHLGRIWPVESLQAYHREADFWEGYCRTLDALANSYDAAHMPQSAAETRANAEDIRNVLKMEDD